MRIVVVGAGHAGIEAALAASRLGAETFLITIYLETIAQMSCNPAIGGIAKSHLVKEIDVFRGAMPQAADFSGIHFKVLNRSKGPAVRATRTQNDKAVYRHYMKKFLEQQPNLKIVQGVVEKLIVRNNRLIGVRLLEGEELQADAVIITTGTFLNGTIFIGRNSFPAGRANEPPSVQLAESIRELGYKIIRLKTGTPMRIHADSIDWEKFTPQEGDPHPQPFSFYTKYQVKNKIVCYLGYTTAETKKIVEDNLHLSALYSGMIRGIGPRYCPSFEDKVVKFNDKEKHHFFLEPEGLTTKEVYINGLSNSLPLAVQKKILSSIPGLKNAHILRPAYAIEYDAIASIELFSWLESRKLKNLFFAGQINGTSGYEEAAAQGLMAGINAVLCLKGSEPLVLRRDEAYIGVLIDDLVTRGVDEPYRLFTSRAEYRLKLREDNAFLRLGEKALRLGLISARDYQKQERLLKKRAQIIDTLKTNKVNYQGSVKTLYQLLKMPEFTLEKVAALNSAINLEKLSLADISFIEAEVKYEGYLKIQEKEVAKLRDLEKVILPADLNYEKIPGLSTEIRQKLRRYAPHNLAQASRISGITPASLTAIRIYLALQNKKRQSES